MVFAGGPPCYGPGSVVSCELKEPIRSHHDLIKGEAKFHEEAVKFYTALAEQAATNGHVIDIFACCLDQVGLAEMIACVQRTGGVVVLDDSFTRGAFTGSINRVFALDEADNNDLIMAFGAEMQAICSKELKIQGAIGSVVSLERGTKSPFIAETKVGCAGTCAWRLGGIDHTSTVALFFEVQTQADQNSGGQGGSQLKQAQASNQLYIQIATKYRHSSGRLHLRVSTLAKTFANINSQQGLHYIKVGFDQECAAVLMTRWAIQKSKTQHTLDILRWLDQTLIKLVSKTNKKAGGRALSASKMYSIVVYCGMISGGRLSAVISA